MFYVFADGASIFNPLDDSLSILSPKVTLELGKSGSFQFNIPPSNDYYNRLEQLKTSIIVELDNTEIFRGRVLSITRGFNNIKSVYCEGILSYLVDSVQKARRFNGKAATLYDEILRRHNGMVEGKKQFNRSLCTFGVENATVVIPGKKEENDAYFGENKYEQAIIESLVDEWQTTYDYINTLFIDYLGGYLIAKYDQDTRTNYINYISNEELDSRIEEAQRSNRVDHEIEFGVNMVDFEEDSNAEDMFTVLIPLGEGEEKVLTIEGATNKYSDSSIELVTIQGKQIGIADREARAEYGSIVKTFSFDNVNEANTLFSDAVRYLKLHKNMPITYTIRAVDLHFVNKTNSQIEIGDTVKITSQVHGVDRYLLCTKIEYDLANPANTSYTFGNPKQSLTERYKKNKDKDKKDSQNNDKRGAKGGGGAAGAARDDAIDEAQDIVDKLYDAYIKVDDAAGTITMATLYHDMVDGVKKLKAMSGIDLSAGPDAAKVNIYTMYDDIGKANTRITQVSDALGARIELVSQYAEGVNQSLNTFKQEANGKYATQEMVSQFKTETSTAIAGIKSYADGKFATTEQFSKYQSETSEAIAGVKTWASGTFAGVGISAEFDGKLAASKSSIEGWATDNFAKITIMTDYKTDKGRTLANIESIADANKAQIELNTENISDNAETAAGLSLISTNIMSVLKAVTNYNDLEINPKTGLIEGNASKASLNVTSSNVRSAIDSDTNFATYINGKMTAAKTSISQLADANKAKIELVASFDTDKNGKITIESFRDGAINAIKSKIKLSADNIELEAQKTISLSGEKTIVKNFLETEAGHFKRNVYFDKQISVGEGISCTGTLDLGTYQLTCGKIVASKNMEINASIVVKGEGHTVTIDGSKVALAKDVPNTTEKIRTLFQGKYNSMANALRDDLRDGYTSFASWIKNKAITEQYIKGYITEKYIKSFIDGDYIRDALKGSYSTFTEWLMRSIGCTKSGKQTTLDLFVRDKAENHTHDVPTKKFAHNHRQADGNFTDKVDQTLGGGTTGKAKF